MKYDVTIGIPMYNVENYIERTMLSALSQTYPSIEYLVLDDGSDDSTIVNIGAFHIKLLHSRYLWTLQVCGAQVDFHHTFNKELMPIWSTGICF